MTGEDWTAIGGQIQMPETYAEHRTSQAHDLSSLQLDESGKVSLDQSVQQIVDEQGEISRGTDLDPEIMAQCRTHGFFVEVSGKQNKKRKMILGK